jgi:DNA-binding beta-propeller fold protein YncE
VVVGLGIGLFAALHGGGGKNEAASGTADNATKGAGAPAAALAPLTAPGCRDAVAKAPTVTGAKSESVAVGDQPFAVTTTSDGNYTFVTRKDAIVVLASHGGLAPAVDHVISVPGVGHGAVLTHDGKYLITVLNSGAVVLDVAAAERGSSGAVVGTLSSSFGSGAFGVAISPDDQFAFVTLQNSAALAVFNLKTALSRGFGSADVVGKIGLGQQPAGLGLSADNRWLYAASENTNATSKATNGMVTVIDTAVAETDPAKAVKARVPAGCAPVRVIASGDGQTVWVTSRDSDALLGFSAARLVSDPAHALKAQVDVGTAPIGETLASVNGQARILVADSNLNLKPGAVANVAVIDPAKALRRVPSLLGYVSTGTIPRQFTIQPDGRTALVTNNGSGQLQAIDLTTLP